MYKSTIIPLIEDFKNDYFSKMKLIKNILFILLSVHTGFVFAQTSNSKLIDSLVKTKSELFQNMIANHEKYKIQIIYTQINRDSLNIPHFKNHYYFYDSTNYFYCASMVKLPCSILALEKINEFKSYGISKETSMITDSASLCQKKVLIDTSSQNKFPSVEHYIKKMLLISDNHAYGRIFEFLGVDYIHKRLADLGFPKARIIHRFDGGCKGTASTTTNPIIFKDLNQVVLFKQEQQSATKIYSYPYKKAEIGKAYLENSGKKINKPKDFSSYNYLSLLDVHKILQRLVFQQYLKEKDKYKITHEDWFFLMKYLSMYPKESDFPKYDPRKFHDSYKKYFLYGDSKKEIKDSSIRIYNIVGQSYGFMADCAYIVDFNTKTEFMLSAVIYANEKNIINTGRYEYNSIALPYLSNLGKLFYNYELSRKKKNLPELNALPH